LCEHHLLPFFGVAHIGYIPNGKVLGLSKFGRVTNFFAKQPQLQERLTRQIGLAIDQYLAPVGTIVILEGTHTCMSARGVLKQNAMTRTSYVSGVFKTDLNARQEALSLIKL
jgi:GTP cyclohydrolase I